MNPKGRFLFEKRGWFYFQRRVPVDLRDQYRTVRLVRALRTQDRNVARDRAHQLAIGLERYWSELRFSQIEQPFRELQSDWVEPASKAVSISDVKSLYLQRRMGSASKPVKMLTERAFREFIEVAGEKSLRAYTRTEANQLRDRMMARGMAPQSASRVISSLKAAFGLAIREHDMGIQNIFEKMDFEKAQPVQPRRPFTNEELRRLQHLCRQVDDPQRHLLSLISDTGMRLGEACGLLIEDLKLNHEVPHVQIRRHPWRPLKTASSQRKVPLVGASLWAAQRLVDTASTNIVFPSYCDGRSTKANSASAALNKWLQANIGGDGLVVHSLRHTLRDRLRAVGCPNEITDEIGGWAKRSVGEGYGAGHTLDAKLTWMERLSAEIATTHEDL